MSKPLALYPVMLGKLRAWEISARAREVGMELAGLSLGLGLWEVQLQQRELTVLTGLGESCVSKAIAELEEGGVLQVRGKQRGRIFRLLPNAEYIEPPRRVDECAARALRAEIAGRNRGRMMGDEADRQGTLAKALPMTEQLAQELAVGSAERALEDMSAEELRAAVLGSLAGAGWSADELAAVASSRPPSLPAWQAEVASVASSPPVLPARERARVESKADRQIDESVRTESGAVAPGGSRRFRDEERNWLVERLDEWLPIEQRANADFNLAVSRNTWLGRIRDEPGLVLRAFGTVKETMQRNKVVKPLGYAWAEIRKMARAAGRALRSVFFLAG